ncbi:MAG: aldehyde dehydrogenase family protein, partial [Acidimicrobiia bacterium]|nr:aldehyde dehydrogenase family protein [Acidimicrobiia bacterium]
MAVKDLKLFIAGEWTEGTGDEVYEIRSPVTGEHIANVPIASEADINRAVAAARVATEELRHWSPFERADLCHRIGDVIDQNVEE